jgi:hypothetical protein
VPQSSCYTVSFLPLQLPFVSKSIISIWWVYCKN